MNPIEDIDQGKEGTKWRHFEPKKLVITKIEDTWVLGLKQFSGSEFDIVGIGETRDDAIKDALVEALHIIQRLKGETKEFLNHMTGDACLSDRFFFQPQKVDFEGGHLSEICLGHPTEGCPYGEKGTTTVVHC